MSREDLTPPVCKKRFKGIENFLKRVAFNLGNTPSQTEVKVISCIPIDVTDLQQKIIYLEKQLEEVKGGKGAPAAQTTKQSKGIFPTKRTSVNTALLQTKFLDSAGGTPAKSTAAISCKSLDCDRSTSPTCVDPEKKSNVSIVFPKNNLNENTTDFYEKSNTSQNPEIKPNNIVTFGSDNEYINSMLEPKQQEPRRYFFKKKKKLLKNKKVKSPCVYYAHTNTSPFNRSEFTEDVHMQDNVVSRSYLAQMINKQYRPKPLGDNSSVISEYSSPVCRDDQPHCEGTCRYESDICSCCHGPFHNIDNQICNFNNPQTYMVNEMNTGSAYYDTNQYDLVPVREKPVKNKKDERDMPRKKEPKTRVDIKCWPENVRAKQRYYSYPPVITRVRTDYSNRDGLEYYMKKMPVKCRIEPTSKNLVKRRKEMYKREHPISIATSKSCSIDYGTVYPKKVFKKPNKQIIPMPIIRKNAECLTNIINNSECQTITSDATANLTDAKTEATLNQIKSILQSVLAEVKVSSQIKRQLVEEKPKKDAVVQKGPSQSNMQTSSFMNSITYSPYTINPSSFIPSCSRQLNPNQFYYPQSALKCFQNFPLFIQGPGRHMCAACYRNSSHGKSNYIKQATTAATNTEDVHTEERSKETEKLIKEIYKSMALTLDAPNKDTSLSEYDDIMKSVEGFPSPIVVKTEPKKHPKKIRNVVQAVSELFMKRDIVDSSEVTPKSTIEQQSKLTSNDTSTQSQMITTDTDVRIRKDRLEQYLRVRKQNEQAEAEKRSFREEMVHNEVTVTETETSSSEAESDTTLALPKETKETKHKKEKAGLFSKMFKSVKLFKQKDKGRKTDVITESEAETYSDSDDYQTVYSQKIDKTVKNKPRAYNVPKHKTHSKISYKQMYQRDRSPEKKKSPYMEQEYRRYWNERLMFHNANAPRQSSELVYSEQTAPQKSAYHRSYEARSAFVGGPTKTHIPKVERGTGRVSRDDNDVIKGGLKSPSKGMAWLKKHKMGIHCGPQWKKFILEG